MGLYTNDLEKSFVSKSLNAKILYEPQSVPNYEDYYRCLAIEDLDENKIEIVYYDNIN